MANTPSNEVDADLGNGTADIPTVPVTDADFDIGVKGNNMEREKLIPNKEFHDEVSFEMTPPPYKEIQRTGMGKQPKDYLVGAILAALFCCVPLGIVAIIRAMTVRVEHANGDAYKAIEASRSARRFIILSVVVGFCLLVIAYTAMYLEAKYFLRILQQQQCLQTAFSTDSQGQIINALPQDVQC